MKKNVLLHRLSKHIGVRSMVVAVFAAIIMSFSMTAAAQTTGSLAGQQCPQSVHDSYTTVGPDGNVYPTWHPPVDPTYGCWFDHEHGSDPHLYVGFAASGMPPFGYTATHAGLAEPHEGFKVYVTNNDGHGRAWMIVVHQGTRGPKRAFTQFHSVEWYISTMSGQKLVEAHTMADFGYASANCTAPGNPKPASVAIPGTATGYPFSQHQAQRREVPTIDCASTRPYESWTGIINIANVFKAVPTFDIDNPSTVVNPNNPDDVHFMCEYRNPEQDCTHLYYTQWSGNMRGVLSPHQQVSNSGPVDFFTDPYGKVVSAGTAGAVKQYVTNQGWADQRCNCGLDGFRLPKNSGGIYVTPDPGAGNDRFGFGPGMVGVPPPPPGGGNPPPVTTPLPPLPTTPSVVVYVNTPNAKPGENVEVLIGVANLKGLYGLQTVCTVDQNILIGMSHADGTVFKNGNSFFVDSGFNAGNWTVAASLLQPNPAFSGAAVAYKLNFKVQNAGSTAITCTALAVDKNGKELPASIINGSFNSSGGVVQPTMVTPPPVVVTEPPPPTMPPPATLPPPSSALSTISGVAAYQNHPDNAGITVQLVNSTSVLATVTTNADGKFTFTDVPVGSYGVSISAPEHLRIGKLVNVTVDGQAVDAGKLTLPAGDTDDSGMIDILDASLVGANFNNVVPPSPLNADLNNDGKVDIRDLALIGSNFGLSGPVVVQ